MTKSVQGTKGEGWSASYRDVASADRGAVSLKEVTALPLPKEYLTADPVDNDDLADGRELALLGTLQGLKGSQSLSHLWWI